MGCKGNFPTFKYVTVEDLVIMYNDTPYPIKRFYTNKKYIVWNINRPYQLEDTNVRPDDSLLEYLIVINDNGKPTIVDHDNLSYCFDQLTTGGNLTSSGDYNALKEQVGENTKKYNLIINTVDDMTQIIGKTEELEDGSIIYNLNKVKADSESYGISISEIQTQINDKYKEIKPILLTKLIEYLRSVSEYKLGFTNLKEDVEITSDELQLINTNKTTMNNKLSELQSTLDDLNVIFEEVNDTTNLQIIGDVKTQLTNLNNQLISLCDTCLLDNKISGEEKGNIVQKAYELSTYIGTVQNTCNNITVDGLGGVVYSVENQLQMLKDSTTSSITELNRNNESLEQKYTTVKQTTESIVEEVGELSNKVGDISSTSKKTVRSVITYYTLSSSNSEIVGYDFSNIKPGDIIFQGNKDNNRYKGVYHVAIYYGKYNEEDYVIECTSKSDVKKHTDGKTCGLCLRKWANVKKSDIVCIARPNSSSTNRVFDGASEFLTLAKAYYDKREQYFTYSQYNLWTNNSSKTWSETTVQGTDSPDGLYRHLDCSGYVNLVMRGIPFDEVFANESVFNAKDLSKRTNYTWTNELPRLAAEQCQEAENLGWDLKGSELHSVNEQWYTSVPENPDNFYIWSKNVTTYVDGTTAESEITCLSNDLALDGRSIVSTTPYYYESSSSTETIDGNWTTIPPRWSGEKYVWTKSLILYDDDTTDWTPESCVSGISSKTLELTTDAYTVAYNSDGTPKTTKAINLSAVQRNYKDTITWETVPSVTLNGSGISRQLPVSTFNSIDRVTVKITSGGLSDEVTICKVQDGSQGIDGEDAYTILLTNPSHTFVGDSESALASNTTCGIIAYKGTTQVNTTVSTISNVPQGMTINISNNNSKTTVLNISVSTTLTSKNGTVTIPITVDGKSFTQLFTYSIAFGGVDGISVVSTDVEYGISSSPTVKPTKWTTEYQSGGRDKYIWSRVRTAFSNGEINYSNEACISGMTGLQGEQGVPGKDAVTYYTWIKYADDVNGGGISNDPTNKEYIGFAYNKTTATESNNPSDYTWSLIKGTDGVKGADGEDGKTFYTWIKYSDNADGTNMYDVPNANTLYIGIATNKTTSVESTDKTQYTWSRFKGEQGVKGDKGTDGRTTYFHIKYSSVANPTSSSQMTETPSAYIGTYVDYTEADSTDPQKYNWSRFQGMQGEQGIPGINGENGTSSYLHTKYSNDGGKTFTSNNGEDLGTYIGVCVDDKPNDPTTVSSYNWSKIEGREITSITEQYYLSTSKSTRPSETDSGWKDICPTWEMGKYIWTRTKIVYANPTETVYQGYYVDTSWEAINDLEIGGRNYISEGKGDNKNGFFKYFDKVENGYGEHTLTSKKQYSSVSITPGFILGCRDYEVGRQVTISYEIMYTKWDCPIGTSIGELWMGQRYGGGTSESSQGAYTRVTSHNLPIVGQNGCELNKWFKVENTRTIPEQAHSSIGTQSSILFYNSNADVSASITFRIRDVKLEYGNKATDWTPAPEDIENKMVTLTDDLSRVEKKANEITNYVGKNTRYGKIRYIRDYLNGSTANTGNHWVEIQAYRNGTNIASGKTVTSNATPSTGTLSLVTNGDTTAGNYVQIDTRVGGTTEYKDYSYVQVDLGAIYTDVNKIKVWHHHSDARQYNHILEVSSDGTTWYTLFNSEKQGTYAESANGRTYVIDGTYSESQIDQTANKISWVVKSGTSSSTMILTDDFYSVVTKNIRLKADNISLEGLVTANSKFKILTDGSMEATNGKFSGSINGGSININNIFKVNTSGKLTATGADIGGKITITDGSISLNNGAFVVSSLGNTKIGGNSPCTVNGYARARCEITSNGNIYVCSSTDSEVYTYFEEGKFYQHGTEGTVSITNGQVKISDGSTATTYGDGFISHNLSIMVDTPILNCTQSVYASEFRGQGNCVMKAPTGSGVYLLTNGASIGDNENTNGVKTIRYFKNTNGDYVFRTNSLNGSCYNGTSSYPWKQVAAKEFNNTSDRTLKENIVYLSNSSNYSLKSTQQLTVDDLYNFVKNDLPITMYNYIGDDSKKIGFIAQDIIYNVDETDNIVGQLIVNPKAWNEEEGKLTYDINNYISVLAGALQMAMKKIDVLEGKINGN